jgi:hypothetical protein
MARFCSGCGNQLADGTAFCQHCGARQAQAPPPQAQQQAYYPPPPQTSYAPAQAVPPGSSGSGVKVLFVVLGIFVALGLLGIGATYYAIHRVKEVVVRTANENGIDLRSLQSSNHNSSRTRAYKACQLLSKDQASRLIGEPIDHTEDQGESCLYFGPAGLSAKLAKEVASDTFKRAQQAGGSPTNNSEDVATAATDLARSMGMGANEGVSTDAPLIILAVSHDGKAQMTAITAGKAIFSGIPGAGGAEISNLGDRAIRLGNLGLNVLQGETIIRIVPGPLPGANEKCIAIARAVLPKV